MQTKFLALLTECSGSNKLLRIPTLTLIIYRRMLFCRSKVKSGNQSYQEDRTDCSKEIPAASQSSNDAKRINMSYHQVSQGSQNGTSAKTHIAQVHAVPAYTCLSEEVNSVKTNRANKPTPVAQDTCSASYCNEKIKEGGHCMESFTGPPPAHAKKQSTDHGVKVKHRSNSVDLSYDAREISSGSNVTHHPKVPPSETMASKLDNKNNGDAMRSKETKSQTSKSGAPESATGADSPSYLDDVVDSNSVAAASVAALRKAIEEAQVRMKVAKESMRRKKEGFPDRVKRKSNVDLIAGGRKGAKLENKTMKPEEINTMQTFGEMDALRKVSSELGKPKVRIEQVRSNLGAEEMFVAKEAVRDAQVKLRSSQAEHMEDIEQKEADHKGKVLELKQAENTEKGARIKSTGRNASEKPETPDHTVKVMKESGACEELVHEVEYRLQEVVDETKLIQETLDNATDKRMTVNEDGNVENKVTPFHEPEDYASNLGGEGFIIENKEKVACEPEDGKMVEESLELEGCQKFFRATEELGEGKSIVQEQKGSEGKVEVSSGVEECELTEFLEPVDNERVCSFHGSDSISKENEIENVGGLEDRNRRNECSFLDINQETRHSCQRDANDDTFSNVYVQEIMEDILDHVHDDEEIYERNVKDSELDGNGTVQDAQASEDEFKGATHLEDSERERKDNAVPVEVMRVTQTDPNYEETRAGVAVNATETSSSHDFDETMKLHRTQIADTIIENDETLEVTLDDIMIASKASFQHQEENDCNLSMLVEETTPESVEVCKDTKEATVASNIGEPDMKAWHNEDQFFEKAENDRNPPVLVDETTEFVEIWEDAKENTVATNMGETDLKVMQNQDQCLGKAENDCNPAVPVEETTSESVETCTDAMETRFASDEEIDEKRSYSSTEEILFDKKDKIDSSQTPAISELQSSPYKKEEVKSMTMEEKEAIGKSQKAELEKGRRKKIDEAKEREREKGKEKLAVERAIREARERAFADARGRAALERAAAEARQRNIPDGRERVGKISSQANEKTPAEKAAMEAKLKAERAAVERATAEARARALSRALSEKAASEARNKSDKSFAEKYFGSSRDNVKKQNFQSKSFSYGGM